MTLGFIKYFVEIEVPKFCRNKMKPKQNTTTNMFLCYKYIEYTVFMINFWSSLRQCKLARYFKVVNFTEGLPSFHAGSIPLSWLSVAVIRITYTSLCKVDRCLLSSRYDEGHILSTNKMKKCLNSKSELEIHFYLFIILHNSDDHR